MDDLSPWWPVGVVESDVQKSTESNVCEKCWCEGWSKSPGFFGEIFHPFDPFEMLYFHDLQWQIRLVYIEYRSHGACSPSVPGFHNPFGQDAAVITLGIRALSETCTAAAISPYLVGRKQNLKRLENSVDIHWFRCNNPLEKIEYHRTSS